MENKINEGEVGKARRGQGTGRNIHTDTERTRIIGEKLNGKKRQEKVFFLMRNAKFTTRQL